MNDIAPQRESRIAAQPIVSFRKVSKSYGSVLRVVNELDLDIRAGEFLTLLGPSGSGKTTTLMMLAGFETPSEGKIFLDNRDVTHLPAYARDMGVVFQSYALFPHMSIAENVAFPLAVRKVPAARRKELVERALELVHLPGMSDRRPQQLSGGQQQRVALARALVYEPRLVLMDEPLGALDKALRENMQAELKQLHEQLGVTFVFVTHDQDEALTMSDRVAVFNEGRIAQIASPEELYRRPANRFVAGFVGETNFIEGTVAAIEEGLTRLALANGTTLTGTGDAGLRIGGTAALVIRPEAVRLCEPGQGQTAGQVQDVMFHGDHLRMRVLMDPGIDLQVKLNPSAGFHLPIRGERVGLVLPAEACVVLA